MHYRRATIADLDLLAEWNYQLIRDEGHRNPMPVSELRDRMGNWLSGEYEALVFEDEGVAVAYALCRHDGEEIYIRHLFVEREHRRRGLGRQVIQLLVSEIFPGAPRVVAEVLTTNSGGLSFWKAVGFRDYSVAVEMVRGGV